MINRIIGLLFTAMLTAACNSSYIEPSSISMGYDFYPLEKGFYREYLVNHIVYNKDNADTSVYFLKEVISDSVINQEGKISYIQQHYMKLSDTAEYVYKNLSLITKSETNIVHSAGNLSVVEFIFPVNEGANWDKNVFNAQNDQIATYTNTHQPDTITDFKFNGMVTVLESFIEDPIVLWDVRFENYAQGVGLIYKESVILHWCQLENCNEGISIDEGSIFRQTLIAYGKE